MNKISLFFALICCLIAGSSVVQGEDGIAAPKEATFQKKLGGCVYNGIFIAEGQSKPVAPCENGTCRSGKVEVVVQGCPAPPSNCRYESTLEQCCNMICDGSTIDLA